MTTRRYKLGFADFYSSSETELAVVECAYEKNRLFWGKSRSRFNIFHCDTEEEFRRYSQPYYFKIARAVALPDGDIVVRSRAATGLTRPRYQQVMTHEINHSFWLDFTPTTARWSPFWLLEATACLVAENHYLLSKADLHSYILVVEDNFSLPYRYMTRYLSSLEQVRFQYSLWYHFLKFLLEAESALLPGLLFEFFRKPGAAQLDSLCESYFGARLPELKSNFVDEYFDGV